MGKAIKLSVIGAGSAEFSVGLVKDICLTESLSGSHISFMDIDQERLDVVHRLATRYAAQLGSDLTFESTTDRRGALQDADFVINTAAAVGHHTNLARREVIAKHGYYYGRVNMGSFHNLQLMLDVVHDMEEVCGDAWLIQSGNPVFDGCTLMNRESDMRIIGLCHGHYGYRKICQIIGIDPSKVTWQAPGLNHNIWLTHFIYEGRNAYPLLDEWIETKAQAYWANESPTNPISAEGAKRWSAELSRAWEIDLSKTAVHQYMMYGLISIGDSPRRAGWWYHKDFEAKLRWLGKPWGGQDSHLSWPLYVQNLERRLAEMESLANDPDADLVATFGTTPTSEQQVPIIDALVNNHEGQFQVNVPNRGILEGIPDDVVVEVPAIINQMGVQPYVASQIPPNIMLNEIIPDWLRMERSLLAFKTGDRAMLLWDVLDHHQTESYDQAVAVLEDVLSMESMADMAAHYRWPVNWREL
jgi:alpha-galactosidase